MDSYRRLIEWGINLMGKPTGESGYSGYSGRSGYSGAGGGSAGASGASGYSGYSGTSGKVGTQGTTGVQGAQGWSGFSGASGYSGAGIGANIVIPGSLVTGVGGGGTGDIALAGSISGLVHLTVNPAAGSAIFKLPLMTGTQTLATMADLDALYRKLGGV